ncbi:MAG: hypothetical protein HQM08_21435 [Candidatus Riflebacteria bacterium]|nr:hypothetical protein [Candidatus Riflebacteria bacterium]
MKKILGKKIAKILISADQEFQSNCYLERETVKLFKQIYFSKRILFPILLIFIFFGWQFFPKFSFAAEFNDKPPLPIKLLGTSDVLEIGDGKFKVREFLDIKNNSNSLLIEVKTVKVEVWKGHRLENEGENWLDTDQPFYVGPGENVRVAERIRLVNGVLHSHWRIRWIRFHINTNLGEFYSNFIDSPFWEPGDVLKLQKQNQIDSLSQP